MKKRVKIFIRILLFCILFAIAFFFYIFVYRGINEPITKRNETSMEASVHSLKQTKKILKQYDEFFTEEVTETLSAEKNFGTYLIPGLESAQTVRSDTKKKDICTSMTPQGMDVTDDYIFVSAYCHTKRHNSVIYMMDGKTGEFIKEIILPNRTHAGGLAYDNINRVLWVTDMKDGKAAVSLYTLEAMENYDYEKTKKPLPFLNTHILDGLTRNSFMAFRGGNLYAGYFSMSGTSVINRYSVNFEKNKLHQDEYEELNEERKTFSKVAMDQKWADILSQVQGLEVFGNYLFLSQSYGYSDSRLRIYEREAIEKEKYSLKTKEELKSYRLPTRMEQICVHGGKLYMLFESGAYAYRGIPVKCIDRIISVNLNDILKDLK